MKLPKEYTIEIRSGTRLLDEEAIRRDLESHLRRALSEGEHLDEIINFLGQGCTIYNEKITREYEFFSDYHWQTAIQGGYDYLILEDRRCET